MKRSKKDKKKIKQLREAQLSDNENEENIPEEKSKRASRRTDNSEPAGAKGSGDAKKGTRKWFWQTKQNEAADDDSEADPSSDKEDAETAEKLGSKAPKKRFWMRSKPQEDQGDELGAMYSQVNCNKCANLEIV